MRCRHIAVIAAAAAAVGIAAPPAPAQTAPDASAPARTAWGDPDLQGIWNNATLTPFQRPEALGDQEFLTEEEAAQVEQRSADRNAELWDAPPRRTAAGGNVGAYNNFWMERGTTVVPTRRTSMITDPPNGRLPALTPETAARLASPAAARLAAVRRGDLPADTYAQLDLGDRCLWYRGIPSFPTGYNNNYHIVQTPDLVAILQEHIHDVRFIPLDGRPHLPEAIRQYAGDSRGRWEGETLVVETVRFNDQAFIRNFNGTLGPALRVVERFTRVGPDTLDYEFTVDDPATWIRPWGGSLPMSRIEEPMFEYACHEGNYGLTNILAGSRAQEAAVAAAALLAAPLASPVAAQREGWTRPFPGHRVIGNLYAVGTWDLAVFLVTSDEGHFLINTGLEDSIPLIEENMTSLGFALDDVRVLLTMQAHWDHTAALAAIKARTGAEMWATAGDAPVLEDGGFSDPHFGGRQSFAPVAVDRIIEDGERLALGGAALTVLLSPGHTAGSVSYTMTVQEDGRDYDVVIANMGTINPGKQLVVDPTYPGVADDFAETFRRQKALDVDVWVAAHGGQYGLHDKYEAGQAYDPGTFVDPDGFRAAVERLEGLYQAQLADERR